MLDDNNKEVDFEKYCKICEYYDKDEVRDPCNECLDVGCRESTEKPLKFVEIARKSVKKKVEG